MVRFLLIISIVFLKVSSIFAQSGFDTCEPIVEIGIVDTSPSQSNGSVEVKGKGRIYCIFGKMIGDNEKILTEDLRNNSLDGLRAGRYFCYVVDERGCRKRYEFNVR